MRVELLVACLVALPLSVMNCAKPVFNSNVAGYFSQCTTVSGADPGSKCIFPFIFDGVRYTDCTRKGSDDGKEWCSTKVDYQRHHIGGKGNWGHCPSTGCSRSNGDRWSTWGSWSTCSATCGGGERSRSRSCSGGGSQVPQPTFKSVGESDYGGGCSGLATENIGCNTEPCCACGSWGAWGRCKGRCGGVGSQRRSRSCRQRNCEREESRSCSIPSCSSQTCGNGIRVRKNVNSLSRQERRRLVSALQSAIRRGEYQKIGNYHGAPTNLCGGQPCCPHDNNKFLPWHRLFMVHMEEELGEALPYWDWTEDGGVPSLWEGIEAPIQQGEVGECSGTGFSSRSLNIQVNPTLLKAWVEAALMQETFEDFSAALKRPHDELHVAMRCDMMVTETAAYDPLFYLHHAYVDYVFAYWQELQHLRGHKEVPTVRGHTDTLAPFDDRRHNSKPITLRNNRGRDTFEYTEKYCFEYQDLKFDGKTPEDFLRGDGKGVFTSGKPPFSLRTRIFIGVVTPKIMPSGFTSFDLCLEGRCVEAGKVASFGSRNPSSTSQEVDSSSHKLTEYDVTDLVAEQSWDEDDDLHAVLTSSLVAGLPEPVIIRRFRGQQGEVDMPRGQTLEDYGDLLDKYSIVDGLA